MKLSFLLLTITISGVMMSPTINRRQNDVQKCVKGQGDTKGKAYDGKLIISIVFEMLICNTV